MNGFESKGIIDSVFNYAFAGSGLLYQCMASENHSATPFVFPVSALHVFLFSFGVWLYIFYHHNHL
jgi:hypothetical protein